MTLNRRLLLGIAPILVIFLAVGLYAIFLFSKLGGAIDVILRENYQSVVASQNMKEATDGMNAGLLLAMGGDEEKGKALFEQNAPVFEKNLDVESHNITLPGEGDLAARVTHLHDAYMKTAAQFFALPASDPNRRALYSSQLVPLFAQTQDTAGRILEINQQNMVDANNEARRQGHAASSYMIGTLIAGFVIAAAVTYLLARSITQPIQNLTESAQELGEGNLNQHVTVQTEDEVGKLAAAFNKMASRLRDYRRSTTDQILRAQQVTESALRAFPDPIFVFSPEKEIQLQNAAADAFVLHLGGNVLLLAPLAAYVDESLKGAADFQPTSFDKAILVNTGDGEKFYMPRVLTMRDETGAALGVVLALQEVTRFRVADDVKTNLIATVSHELKTPLTSMQMAVYLLLEEKVGPLNPKQTELLLAARNNSDRLFDMIEDLLDLARFEGGAALIEKKAVSSAQLVDEIAAREMELVVSRGRELKVEKEALLPRVEISRVRIDQVFANFISNAVKYSPAGSTVTLSAKREDARNVRFSVRDEGPGVPKELRRRIFDKFFRASESGDEGAGLGLSIAREIVLAHGGNIGVECEEGKGSEFFFTLPALV
jgi:signal transduction histidine kinase